MRQNEKRSISWSIERLVEAFFGTALIVVLAYVKNRPGQDWSEDWAKPILLIFLLIIFDFMLVTGYFITTAVAAFFLRAHSPWLYAIAIGLLFQAHIQFLFHLLGGLSSSERLILRIAGGCIALLCAYLGSLIQIRLDRAVVKHSR